MQLTQSTEDDLRLLVFKLLRDKRNKQQSPGLRDLSHPATLVPQQGDPGHPANGPFQGRLGPLVARLGPCYPWTEPGPQIVKKAGWRRGAAPRSRLWW